jgi:proteasome assembly chaperone (PAC2) family protein
LRTSYTHLRFTPKLKSPVLVEGLPGFGNVGKISSELLIKSSEAELFAEYYSPFLPDYVVVTESGVCSPPCYKLFASTKQRKPSVVILTGDSQPQVENVVAHYEICEEILDFAERLGCASVITIGGVPVSTGRKEVYVAASTPLLMEKAVELGGIVYGKGRIMGATGLLLGLAKERRLPGLCLLGATSDVRSDKDAAFAVFEILTRVLQKI